MSVTADIWRSLRSGPRPTVRAHLARGPQEARAFAFLMIGCFIVFVAQWPRLQARAAVSGDDLSQVVAYELLAWLMVWPLLFFALAGLVHLGSRLAGGQGTPYGARLALFWSWLAASPFALVAGAATGLLGPTLAAQVVGALWIALFAWMWAQAQREASRGG